MKKILNILFSIALSSLTLFAQDKNPLVNSGEAIKEGIALHDSEKYAEAIEKFKSVSPSDTNYYTALYELSNSYNYNKEFDKAIECAQLGLSYPTGLRPDFYTSLANAYDNKGDSVKALEIYLNAIKEYPVTHLLYFNAGLTYEKMKNFDMAMQYYQKALDINLFHSTSHLRLGYIMAGQGHTTAAMLSLSMFILTEGQTDRAYNALVFLEKIAKGNYEAKEPITTSYTGETFKELDLIINSKIALNEKYKAKIKLKFDVVKQLQILLEKFQYNNTDKDFWLHTYGPIFEAVFKENKTEAFLYNILLPANTEDVNKWFKNNAAKNSEFGTWAFNKIEKLRGYKEVTVNGTSKTQHYLYYKDGRLYGYGDYKTVNGEDITVGPWKFFYANGTTMSDVTFNDEGKKHGKSKWYNTNGTIASTGEFKNGLSNGIIEHYNEKGILVSSTTYKEDKMDGPYVLYYSTGQKKEEGTYKDDKKEGTETEYFKNGKVKFKGVYKDGAIEGEAFSYYNNGKLEWKAGVKNNKYHGPVETYYINGKIKTKGQYTDGNNSGKWESYHRNGKLSEVKTFNDKGVLQGEYKTYFKNGVLEEESTYSVEGKITGQRKTYTEDGKLYISAVYDNGIYKTVQYIDNQGKTTDLKVGKGKVKYFAKYANGKMMSEGMLEKNEKNGEWKYYDKFGRLTAIENFKNGTLEGPYKGYHENGKVSVEYNYTAGEIDGYYKKYNKNGTLNLEGWYVNGKQQGTWYSYNQSGIIKESYYLINDNSTGNYDYYGPTGKLESSYRYDGDILEKVTVYDSTGKVLSEDKFDKGNGTLKCMYPNGKISKQGTYKNSLLEGEFVWYHGNGKIDTKATFISGKKEGPSTSYFDNGNKNVDAFYSLNERTGTWKYYFEFNPNKLLRKFSYNEFAEVDSLSYWYYDNGKVEVVSPYVDDNRTGIVKYYTEAGELRLEKDFIDEEIVGYAYYKANNERVYVKLPEGESKIVAYFLNGKISSEEEIKDGMLHGKRIFYYSNGQVESARTFEYNNQQGEEINYYPNGKIKSSEPYKDDEKHGLCKYYRADGKLEKEENYILGEKHGISKYYDATGKLIKTVIYNSDEQMSSK